MSKSGTSRELNDNSDLFSILAICGDSHNRYPTQWILSMFQVTGKVSMSPRVYSHLNSRRLNLWFLRIVSAFDYPSISQTLIRPVNHWIYPKIISSPEMLYRFLYKTTQNFINALIIIKSLGHGRFGPVASRFHSQIMDMQAHDYEKVSSNTEVLGSEQ